jgi:hypothetical protein
MMVNVTESLVRGIGIAAGVRAPAMVGTGVGAIQSGVESEEPMRELSHTDGVAAVTVAMACAVAG